MLHLCNKKFLPTSYCQHVEYLSLHPYSSIFSVFCLLALGNWYLDSFHTIPQQHSNVVPCLVLLATQDICPLIDLSWDISSLHNLSSSSLFYEISTAFKCSLYSFWLILILFHLDCQGKTVASFCTDFKFLSDS